MSERKLIVGLGNPGEKYEKTRHNVGFLVVTELARRHGVKFSRNTSCQGWTAQTKQGEQVYDILLPLTYMNHSGLAVKRLAEARTIAPADILVVCDDFNLDFGFLRLRQNGSDGGHNGLSSIIAELGTRDFPRLRVGIGTPPAGQDAADYVLKEFLARESKSLAPVLAEAADCCDAWLIQDINQVMSQFNRRKENGQV